MNPPPLYSVFYYHWWQRSAANDHPLNLQDALDLCLVIHEETGCKTALEYYRNGGTG